MKIHTKLFIAGVILLLLPFGITQLFSLLCFAGGFILLICKGITEITNKNNASKKDYTYTYDVTPKRKQDNKLPWEE